MIQEQPIAEHSYQFKHGDRPLDGYTIQRAAGRGGFGEVYYALSDSGREVALKLVLTYEQIELRGITQCMNLKSQNLVTIFDVKYGSDRRPWIIMEFVTGPSLREMLDAAPTGLGPEKTPFFLREIGKGLTYLHESGIVHRDLKPANIFYENGVVKIGDYGLSKAMSTTRYSGQTANVGSPYYMAPEIGEGDYGRGIDIYALGALVFELLTGQPPFSGSTAVEVLMKHLNSPVNLDAVAEPFKSAIARAMNKNPTQRFQSVNELVEAVCGTQPITQSAVQVPLAPMKLTATWPEPLVAKKTPRVRNRWAGVGVIVIFTLSLIPVFMAMFLMTSGPHAMVASAPMAVVPSPPGYQFQEVTGSVTFSIDPFDIRSMTIIKQEYSDGAIGQPIVKNFRRKQPNLVTWEVSGRDDIYLDANDSSVDTILSCFGPLREIKRVSPHPIGKSSVTYLVVMTTNTSVTNHVRFTIYYGPGADGSDPVCLYNNQTFTVSRSVIDALDAAFAKNP